MKKDDKIHELQNEIFKLKSELFKMQDENKGQLLKLYEENYLLRDKLKKIIEILEKEAEASGCDCDYCLTSTQKLARETLKEIRGENE